MIRLVLLSLPLVFSAVALAEDNLIANGGFEQGLESFQSLWTRVADAGQLKLVADTVSQGKQAVRIDHTGDKDWSFHPARSFKVEPGEIYELSGSVRLEGDGSAGLSVLLRGEDDQVIEWTYGAATTRSTGEWRRLKSRFVIPRGATSIQPRWTGIGPSSTWLDEMSLRRDGRMDELRNPNLPDTLKLRGETLELTLHTGDAILSILDRRSGKTWNQHPRGRLILLSAEVVDNALRLRLIEPCGMLEFTTTMRLDKERPEVLVTLEGDGEMPRSLAFPEPFVTGPGTTLILPVNEGISYPVDDESLRPMRYYTYGGHGLCMGFCGVTDGERGLMTLIETSDDAAVGVPRVDGRLCLAPEWVPQRGRFGPQRRLRWVVFDRGGYVAMCKRYREHAQQVGLLKTFVKKRKQNPHVDLLIGAVNVWCWDRDAVAVCRELKQAGIERILWSSSQTPEVLKQLNAMDILTSRYDIYQDTMNPANFPKLRHVHGAWTTEAWPDDLMLDEHGQWRRGWRVQGKDGQWYPCGVLCDRRAVEYARRRVPAELATHPYRCRFIDTTTASPWRECYHPDHPMTRSDSRHWKMELLRYMSEECGLVTGSETGHEAAVPFVHYFEGMMSLGPYRIPDAGRRMAEVWDEVPERVAKFQTGHFYRLPLWELVYHDCVVAQWYWGDYNNKLPKLWDRRDLWNMLYGTPPMLMFSRKQWEENRERFVQSYHRATPVARATGYHEMVSHRWLTADHAVQETQFANGVTVTVNFGDKPHRLADGATLQPLGFRVDGIKMPE